MEIKKDSPIYLEYYSHDNCNCFKIDMPYPKYNKHVMVLCKESDGYNYAKTIAIGVIINHITNILFKGETP